MSGPVLEIAQTGADVFRAPDQRKTFSSLAASLPISKKIALNVDHVTAVPPVNQVPVYEHGLGYVPIFIPMLKTGVSPLQYAMFTQQFDITLDENFVYSSQQGASAATSDHLLMIIARPLLQEFTSDSRTGASGARGAQSAAHLKITRKGRSIDSTDERDHVVDTDFKTLLIHKQGEVPYTYRGTGSFTSFTVNTGTDVLTVSSTASFATGGTVTVTSITGSGATVPAGLVYGQLYFVTVLTGTTLKLSTTAENLANGVYVDITSTGSGTNYLTPYDPEAGNIEHGLGYPPLFMIYHAYRTGNDAEQWRTIQGLPATEVVTAAHSADNNTLYVGGSNVSANRLAYVIFKDPFLL